jgi:hypothetical protein
VEKSSPYPIIIITTRLSDPNKLPTVTIIHLSTSPFLFSTQGDAGLG